MEEKVINVEEVKVEAVVEEKKKGKVSKKVLFEIHRYLGILRFKEIADNCLYAQISPDNNIITILAKHFKHRLPGFKWIIHDKKRKIAIIYNMQNWIVADFDYDLEENIPDKELFYQELWQKYFENITIKNRQNKKLQQKYIPTRYWKHLVEHN
jgi:probable DNA metabolism protein